MVWLRRFWHLINRPRFERDLMREMADHREQMANPREFGNSHRLLEASRDAWGWNWLDDAVQDLKLGVRTLLRSPSFTISATLILAFGIGLNLTLYQIANAAFLTPPAIKEVESVARFHRWAPHNYSSSAPYPLAEYVKSHNTVLSALMTEAGSRVAWGHDVTDQIEASFVSANWFDQLGYGAAHGRVFAEAIDAKADAGPAVVLGYDFWQNRLGGDPAVIGTTVYIDRKPATAVGIARRECPGLDLDLVDVYIPITQRDYFYPESTMLRAWDTDSVAIYGRLRAGVSPAAAREGLRSTMRALSAERAEVKADEWLEPMMAGEHFRPPDERIAIRIVLSFLTALTTLVLMIAAANLGNLVLSRTTGRTRELGVRVALGAKRSRIVRQLLVETVPLAALGAIGGLVFAQWAAGFIVQLANLPSYVDVAIHWRSILVSGALAALALGVVGLLPAWKVSQQELLATVKDGGHQVSLRLDRTRMRRVLMVVQVAGSCLLLAIASMLGRSLQRVLTADLGFDYANNAVLEMPLGRFGIRGEAARSYWYTVADRIRSSPEVADAAIVTAAPLGNRQHHGTYKEAPGVVASVQHVDPEYFRLMQIRILAGRVFAAGEADAIVISQRLARAMYGNGNVLGEGFPKSTPKSTIVGIAADAHTIRVNATNGAELYAPLALDDFALVYLVARARGDVTRLPPILREAAGQDPRVIPVTRLMRDDFARRMRGPRVASAISAGIGGLTLVLACLGIFGVVSYGVALRTKEIGIHMALGASRPSVLRLVMRQVLSPVGIGIAIGLVSAVAAGVALSGDPFYVRSVDPVAYLIALLVFGLAAASSALTPALKALRADPIRSLRHE